jgi:toxin ParE1/3/4
MRRYRVEFLRRAEGDLFGLYDTIAAQAGPDVAGQYVERIEAACLALETSPMRGTKRDDILPGLRTMGFERRATIAFRVRSSRVSIVRIFYGGRDFERLLRGS